MSPPVDTAISALEDSLAQPATPAGAVPDAALWNAYAEGRADEAADATTVQWWADEARLFAMTHEELVAEIRRLRVACRAKATE